MADIREEELEDYEDKIKYYDDGTIVVEDIEQKDKKTKPVEEND